MNNSQAYNQWAEQYDSNNNKTRDLEAIALRSVLADRQFEHILEIGCGTGKNSVWLKDRCISLTGLDFSEEMLAKAKSKIPDAHVDFRWADIRQPWAVPDAHFDLVTFSLVLEHIEDIEFIFAEVRRVLRPGGMVYLGEFHPFKQYLGSKARFEMENGDIFVLECFNHHTSDFFAAAKKQGLRCADVQEWTDNDDEHGGIPRVLTMVFVYD